MDELQASHNKLLKALKWARKNIQFLGVEYRITEDQHLMRAIKQLDEAIKQAKK